MGCISGFGIAFAAPILALAALPTSVWAQPVSAATSVNIVISGVRNARGNVLACLTSDPKAFPDCGKDPKARKISLPARPVVTARFDDVPPGTYAVALIHDENGNNRMDVALFLPREGFGMSRNPKIGMGPPKFKSAQFLVEGASVQMPISMRYIF